MTLMSQNAYLALDKDGSEAVEELERSDDVTLDQDGCYDGGAGPVARAYGHLVEPLLQWKLADRTTLGSSTCSKHVVHIHDGESGRTGVDRRLVNQRVSGSDEKRVVEEFVEGTAKGKPVGGNVEVKVMMIMWPDVVPNRKHQFKCFTIAKTCSCKRGS